MSSARFRESSWRSRLRRRSGGRHRRWWSWRSGWWGGAAALGAGRLRILFRHILPNCLAPVIVTATLLVAGNILGEAGLSFLGIGVQPPHPSWGGMLAEARQNMTHYWWMCAFPGAAIAL